MSDDETIDREFETIWETQQLEETVSGVAETRTLRPTDETLGVADGGESSVGRLPEISGSPGRETMPEIEYGRKLGEGGSAEVVAARQMSLQREVAVKRHRRDREAAREVLLQEAWVTGRLEHPNIVPIYRLGRDEQTNPLMVMKRIGGVSWEELLADPGKAPREFESEDPLDWHLEILTDVCDAVRYAHDRQIIHRDLKPQNVMVGAFGEVYVLDWGLAVGVGPKPGPRVPKASAIDQAAGTPAYMAPEMVEADGANHGPATDVYLLGAVLHQIITGEPPHDGDTIRKIMLQAYRSEPPEFDDEVPNRLAAICRKAMARDPADRYETAGEFRSALVDFERRRESLALADRAEQRLEELRVQVEQGAGDQEAELYETFGECRFGFERALEIDEDNDRAQAGLQAVMEVMVERELEEGGYKAASLLLADLPEPRPDLEDKLEQLRAAERDREREFEQLKEREREHDVSRGRRARSLFVLAMGWIWGALNYSASSFGGAVSGPFGELGVVIPSVLGVGCVIAGLIWGRRELLQNTANRQLVVGLLVIAVGILTIRQGAVLAEVPMSFAVALERLVSGVSAALLGICIDRRVLVAGATYFAGGLVSLMLPSQVYLVAAVTNVVAMTLLAILWWPGTLESLAGPLTVGESPDE